MTARLVSRLCAVGWALTALGCADGDMPPATSVVDPTAELLGGDTTVYVLGRDAFAQPAANLKGDRRDDFFDGNSLFNRNWVTAPASTTSIDGLGPLFNARSCSSCHFKDGRGRPPLSEDEALSSMLLRVSVPGVSEHGGPNPEPSYGDQLNPLAILGVPGEGDPRVVTSLIEGSYDDGTAYELSEPHYELGELPHGELAEGSMLSPRVAPQMIGLGLLEAIDAEALLARADPEDADGDGISGRPNYVWDEASQSVVLGRFGWKANQPSLAQQSAGAFLGDIGITSTLFSAQNCSAEQPECQAATDGGEPELDDERLKEVVYYSGLLGVPARRDLHEPEALQGEQLFRRVGCTSCHVETIHTGKLEELPELSEQVIHPYTDLLLHDLGDALADGRPDYEADGNEWRTPPLWGIGLFQTVNRHTRYLHDGRARSIEEAVLWHGGEAAASQAAFVALSAPERSQLLRFLDTL
ncbi:MAG TPA: di-heme oxidoredictase family protein [Polyangiaceae bacterium]